MSMSHFLALFLALLAAPAQAAPVSATPAPLAGEPAARQAIIDRVRTALDAEDFASLNAMEEEFRTSRGRTPSGVWNLRIFHLAIEDSFTSGQQDGDCTPRYPHLIAHWLALDPAAPTPTITQAYLVMRQAWCLRGGGFSDSVTPAAWAGFHKYVAAADALLIAHKRTAAVDPEYYGFAEDIAIAKGIPKASFERLLAEAIAKEPAYHRIYFAAMRYYQPQWFGSIEDVDRIARLAAEKSRLTDGDGGYARVYWHYVDCGCEIGDSAVDWTRMKSSMADVSARFPVDWNYVNFARISCRMGDAAEAKHYLAKVRVDDGNAWDNPAEQERCRSLAASFPAVTDATAVTR